jgi:hypothetical protein
MGAKPVVSTITSGIINPSTLNSNFDILANAIADGLDRVGDSETNNQMAGDLDMGGNSIKNLGQINGRDIIIESAPPGALIVPSNNDGSTTIVYANAIYSNLTITLPDTGNVRVIRIDDTDNTVEILPPSGYTFADGTTVFLYQKNESLAFTQDNLIYYIVDSAEVIPLPTYITLNTISDIVMVDTIADLRLVEGTVDGQAVQVRGYYAVGDGGGGPIRYWDSASTATDNKGSIIKPTSISGAGRWLISDSASLNVVWFGADPLGVVESTDAITDAISAATSSVYVPDGTYLCKTIPIEKSIEVYGSGELKLYPDYDQNNVASTATGAAMFDVVTENVTIKFTGLTFNGNEANQNVVHPSLSLIRCSNQASTSTTESLEIIVSNCVFKNQTRASIFIDGETASDGRVGLIVSGCVFLDGRIGIGSGDPQTANENGFAPLYIDVMDRTHVQVSNSRFLYRNELAAIGEYAPIAVRWSWLDSSTNEDGASGTVSNCYFYKCGRKDEQYDGAPSGNNGLGVLDFYSRAKNISITGNTFDDCYNSAVRGKTNMDMVSITSNTINNTPKAINIGPPTYTLQRGYVSIANNVIRNTDAGGIFVVGNTEDLPDQPYVTSIIINGNIVDTVTNVNADTGNVGGIICRYFDKASIVGNVISNVTGENCNGITLRDAVDTCVVSLNVISDIVNKGIYSQNSGTKTTIVGNNIKTCGAEGIQIASTSGTDVVVSANIVSDVVDYGIIVNDAASVVYGGNNIEDVGGSSRGFYLGSSAMFSMVSGNVIAGGVTTPIFYTSNGTTSQVGNSWNPVEAYRAANPTTGTWEVGDKVWSTDPASTGYMGWTCTVAGTPGTWKTFGAVTP